MPLEWVKSKKCASGDVCHICRLAGKQGEEWRKFLVSRHGYVIPEVNFECPAGKEWHVNTPTCRTCHGE